MTKTKAPLKLLAFDAARYLDDDEAIAEYMTAVLESNDPDLLLLALGGRSASQRHGAGCQRRRLGPRESVQGTCAGRKAPL